MPVKPDPCMFCGEIHKGSCGPKPAQKKERVLKVPAPPTESVPAQSARPSKLDRMRAAASDSWTPTVEQVPRTRASRASITEAAVKTERNYHIALDPDTVAINAAVRALADADLLSDKQLEEWSSVLSHKPTLEEEKLLWRTRQSTT